MRAAKPPMTMLDMCRGLITTTEGDEVVVRDASLDASGRADMGLTEHLASARSTKGVTLKLFRISIAVGMIAAAAAMATSAVAGTAAKPKIVPFTASFAGKAVVTVTDQVVDISTTGAGVGTPLLMGAAKITGVGTGSTVGVGADNPCVPFTGTGSMTGVKGKLTFKLVQGSQACGDEAQQMFTVTGRATVTGGAGRLAKAKGPLKLTGTYDRGAGTFNAKLAGKLTLPK